MTTLGVFRDDIYNKIAILPGAVYKTTTQNAGVLTAASFTGAQENYIAASGQTAAQAITTDSAANIVASLLASLQTNSAGYQPVPANVVGLSFIVVVINNNTTSGAITLTGGTGVTITGTNTLAITTARTFLVTATSTTTVTFQNINGEAIA